MSIAGSGDGKWVVLDTLAELMVKWWGIPQKNFSGFYFQVADI